METTGTTGKIPIVIGVTGHRDVRGCDREKLKTTVRTELERLMKKYPHSPFALLDSLAAGADMLCAEAGLELGMRLICPLPMKAEEYEKDFDAAEDAKFRELIGRADGVFEAPHTEPEKEGRDYLYRQAGIYVASHCHLLLALWDGSEPKRDGCGTAETVGFMMKARDEFRAPNECAVLHVMTPREKSGENVSIVSEIIENEKGAAESVLEMTDRFNKDAGKLPEEKSRGLLPGEYLKRNKKAKRINSVYEAADSLSAAFQKKYLSAMRIFSLFGFFLVIFFLLYDEMESDVFLILYGALMIAYFAAYLAVKRSGAHLKYLQYRMVSEVMRVQLYLTAAGIDGNVGSGFTWTQKSGSTWVKKAAAAVTAGENEDLLSDEEVKVYWIDGQLSYHKKALVRDSKRSRLNEKTARVMLILSAVLFAITLLMEFFCKSGVTFQLLPAPLPEWLLPHADQIFTVRSLLKIVTGGVSAFAVLLSNYYGKLSYERKSEDHEKMAELYAAASLAFEDDRASRKELFSRLAAEEIIENGNWVSYCRENPPSFNM